MTMPFIDLKSQYAILQNDILENIDQVLQHGQFILGPEIKILENKLAEFVASKHAITCSSGTDALLMALLAYDIGPGCAVFTTPFTFVATAEVIALLGATPIFVDIDPKTFNIDPQKLKIAVKECIQKGDLCPKGIIAVDLFGLVADYDAINEIAKNHSLFVLEDAAQSFGAQYKNRTAGTLGDIGATSFFPSKPLGCYGDGGAIFTNNDDLAEKCRSIRVHGEGIDKYHNRCIGLNARFDTLQAAILLPKLDIYPREFEQRQQIAKRYSEGLKNVVTTPFIPADCVSAWALYSIVSQHRDRLQAALQKHSIPAAIYYPTPLHLQKVFAGLGYKPGDFPIAETIAQQIISLPMHPYLNNEQIDNIIQVIVDASE